MIKQESYTKVVLIEKINNEYHLSKLPLIQQLWKQGKHPQQCKGNCQLQDGFMMTFCKICGWDDY